MFNQLRKSLEKSSSNQSKAQHSTSTASNYPEVRRDPPFKIIKGKFIASSALGASSAACGSRVSRRSRHHSEGQACGGAPNAHDVPEGPHIDLNVEQQAEQPVDHVQQQEEQPVDVQLGEPEMNCCSWFYDCYKDTVMKFRNSAFIYLLEVLVFCIPVSAIGMGLAYLNDCPKAFYLPIVGIVLGVVGCLFMVVWMIISRTNRSGTTLSAKSKSFFVFFCVLLTIASVVDAVLVYCLTPSSDPTSDDYCHETFYTYSGYKGVATILVVVFSMLLYIPGMRHTVCCEQCQFDHSGRYYAL